MNFIQFLTNFPKSSFFQNNILHVWGAALWTYFFLAISKPSHGWLVVLLALAFSAFHELVYDGRLPNAPPIGSLNSHGRLANLSGYVVGIALGSLLWWLPIVGIVGFWAVAAVIFGSTIYMWIKG